MTRLPLSFAAVNYDRFRALEDGRVTAEGIDLNFVPLPVEEIFYRQVTYREFDVSEMSLSSYVLTLNDESPPFIALPAFPSRYFRHQTMFINERSGITTPEDLRGKRIGVPEYQITAAVWQRGMLQDQYGVHPRDVEFFSGGVEETGRVEKSAIHLPEDVSLQPIRADQTLSRMLTDGDLDALFTAHVPSCYYEEEHIVRLFPNYKEAEKEYFATTGIFPIMHVVVIKRDVCERNPWIARSLMKAFEKALQAAKDDLMYRSSFKVMLPWLVDHIEETVESLGEDYWPYGVEPNRPVLDTFLRYSHEQGLAGQRWQPDDIFVESASSSYKL